MLDEEEQRPSVLVIAAWFEGNRFFARVTWTSDDDHGKAGVVVVNKSLVLDRVADWLATVQSHVT